jgi:hypothetical protein
MTAMGNLPEVVSREEWLAAFRERMGWSFPWYSPYGLAEAGTAWTGGPWTESMRGEEMPVDTSDSRSP